MKKNKLLQKTISRLIEISFKDGKVVEFQVIVAIKVLKSLPKPQAIFALSEYLKSLKRKIRKHTLVMESVVPLSFTQVQKIKKIVGKKYQITKLESKINPEILGGFKLKIGDEVWDESLVGKINQVKEAIIHGGSN